MTAEQITIPGVELATDPAYELAEKIAKLTGYISGQAANIAAGRCVQISDARKIEFLDREVLNELLGIAAALESEASGVDWIDCHDGILKRFEL